MDYADFPRGAAGRRLESGVVATGQTQVDRGRLSLDQAVAGCPNLAKEDDQGAHAQSLSTYNVSISRGQWAGKRFAQ